MRLQTILFDGRFVLCSINLFILISVSIPKLTPTVSDSGSVGSNGLRDNITYRSVAMDCKVGSNGQHTAKSVITDNSCFAVFSGMF